MLLLRTGVLSVSAHLCVFQLLLYIKKDLPEYLKDNSHKHLPISKIPLLGGPTFLHNFNLSFSGSGGEGRFEEF